MTSSLGGVERGVIATRIIAISASAGGLAALRVLLSDLPASLAASILVVQHLQPHRHSHLVEILGWHCSLDVCESRAANRLCCGTVYVAPPDLHLLVGLDRRLVLSQLPPLNFCRPSSDRMFASLAEVYGRHTVAVVLTGRGHDGAAGAQLVRRSGGHVIVQDPETAEYGDMPRAALRAGAVDEVMPLSGIAGALRSLVAAGVPA